MTGGDSGDRGERKARAFHVLARCVLMQWPPSSRQSKRKAGGDRVQLSMVFCEAVLFPRQEIGFDRNQMSI